MQLALNWSHYKKCPNQTLIPVDRIEASLFNEYSNSNYLCIEQHHIRNEMYIFRHIDHFFS